MKNISIVNALYVGDLKIEVFFSNNKKRMIDFENFFQKNSHPQFNKYKNEKYFSKFKIENGNVVWGKNWDMIFPVWDLYKGKVE